MASNQNQWDDPGAADTAPAPGAEGLPAGTTLSDTYEVIKQVALGGMAEVYRARNIHTEQDVAIKVVLPEFSRDETIRALFKKEATILGTLQHDAIVRYHMFTVDGRLKRPYLVMEFVDGVHLGEFIRNNPLDAEAVTRLMIRVAAGLAAAHDLGVIHRDLSPDNIILPESNVDKAKIIDFGIAKAATKVGEGTLLGGKFAGKYNFVSPEQLGLAGGEITASSDIYSLGLIAAAANLGHTLDMSGNGSLAQVLEKRRTIPDLEGVDPAIQQAISAMLEPQPEHRPADMRQVIALWLRQTQQPGWQQPQQANTQAMSAKTVVAGLDDPWAGARSVPPRSVPPQSIPPRSMPPQDWGTSMPPQPAGGRTIVQPGAYGGPSQEPDVGGAAPGTMARSMPPMDFQQAPPTAEFRSMPPTDFRSVPPTDFRNVPQQNFENAPPPSDFRNTTGVERSTPPTTDWSAPAGGEIPRSLAPDEVANLRGDVGLGDTVTTGKAAKPGKIRPITEKKKGGGGLIGIAAALIVVLGGAGFAYTQNFFGLLGPPTGPATPGKPADNGEGGGTAPGKTQVVANADTTVPTTPGGNGTKPLPTVPVTPTDGGTTPVKPVDNGTTPAASTTDVSQPATNADNVTPATPADGGGKTVTDVAVTPATPTIPTTPATPTDNGKEVVADIGNEPQVTPTAPKFETAADRVAWLASYPLGDCAYAGATTVADNSMGIEAYGTSRQPFDALAADFAKQAGFQPDVQLNLLNEQQCSVTGFLAQARASAASGPTLTVTSDHIANNTSLTGSVGGIDKDWTTQLLLVDYEGNVQNITAFMGTPSGGKADIKLPPLGTKLPDPVPLVLIAVSGKNGIVESANISKSYVGGFEFPRIIKEMKERPGEVAVSVRYFTIMPG